MLSGWFLLRPLYLAHRGPSPPCVLTWSPSVPVYVLTSSFYKNTSILDLGLPQWPPLTLMAYLKTLSPKAVTFWGTRDEGFNSSTHNSGVRKTDVSKPRPKHASPCSGSNSFLWIKAPIGVRHSPHACCVIAIDSVHAHKQKGSTLSGPYCRWGSWGMECCPGSRGAVL